MRIFVLQDILVIGVGVLIVVLILPILLSFDFMGNACYKLAQVLANFSNWMISVVV
jgi:hypothetical protein